jgi:hypothetical protein
MPRCDGAGAADRRDFPGPVELRRRARRPTAEGQFLTSGQKLYGGLTVCSLYLFAVCTRLFFQREEQFAVTAMLGKDEVKLPKAARPGDALAYYTECIAKRESRSRPDSGVVTLLDTLCDPAGETVLTQKVVLLVSRRSAPPEHGQRRRRHGDSVQSHPAATSARPIVVEPR